MTTGRGLLLAGRRFYFNSNVVLGSFAYVGVEKGKHVFTRPHIQHSRALNLSEEMDLVLVDLDAAPVNRCAGEERPSSMSEAYKKNWKPYHDHWSVKLTKSTHTSCKAVNNPVKFKKLKQAWEVDAA